MRIDKFLNSVNIAKNRTQSQDMINNKVVYVNNKLAKSSLIIKTGDIVEIRYLKEKKIFEIIKLPKANSTKKNEQFKYIKDF